MVIFYPPKGSVKQRADVTEVSKPRLENTRVAKRDDKFDRRDHAIVHAQRCLDQVDSMTPSCIWRCSTHIGWDNVADDELTDKPTVACVDVTLEAGKSRYVAVQLLLADLTATSDKAGLFIPTTIQSFCYHHVIEYLSLLIRVRIVKKKNDSIATEYLIEIFLARVELSAGSEQVIYYWFSVPLDELKRVVGEQGAEFRVLI